MPPRAKGKPVFKTAIPYTETSWPEIPSAHQENILDLLCGALQPLGDHRRTHVPPSKGKKRKRKPPQQPPHPHSAAPKDYSSTVDKENAPPPPEIGSHILIGLNSVTRHLEALAARHAPPSLDDLSRQRLGGIAKAKDDVQEMVVDIQPLAVVIIPHVQPSASLPHAHVPALIHLSNLHSTKLPSELSTRLVTLPPSSETRLASALHIPHVGAIAIKEGAPGTSMLVKYVRDNVGLTKSPWIDEAMGAKWMPTKVDAGK